MNFLIQTNNGEVIYDFTFVLKKNIDYLNNFVGSYDIRFSTSGTGKGQKDYFIPVGSVEFVHDYMKEHLGFVPKPINIPEELMGYEFLGRNAFIGDETDLQKQNGRIFVKSNDEVKGITDIMSPDMTLPKGNYLYSEVVEFTTEWRAFIYKNKIIGLHNYSGDFMDMPDADRIQKMVETWNTDIPAYTLDVGKLPSGETVLVEVHMFYSCGTYGFDSPSIPFMFQRTYEYLKKSK